MASRASLSLLLFVTLLATGAFGAMGRAASACRGPFPSLGEAVGRASVIVVARLEAVVDDGPYPQLSGSRKVRLRLRVEEALKGGASGLIEVAGDTTSCGFGGRVEVGQRWLILAGGSPLATSALSPNQLLLSEADRARAVAGVRAALAAPAR